MLALFHAKFACISAIRYHVFRWESYKGCVWESVKNSKCHTCEICRKLMSHDSWSTTGQKGQSSQLIILRLKLATHPGREWVVKTSYFVEKCLFTFLTYPTINSLIPTKCRELLERKTLENNKIDSFTILYLWFSNFSTLNLSIDIPLRGSLTKSLSHRTHICEEVLWCLGSNLEMTNSFGWCNELIAKFRKLKKTQLGLTLLEQEAWRA